MGFTDFLGDILDPGDLFGTHQDSRIERANAAAQRAYDKAEEMKAANEALNSDYWGKINNTYGGEASKVGDRVSALENLDVYNPGEFDYTGSVNDFYSKAANQRIKDATDKMREYGDLWSSDFADAMLAKQTAMASEEWDKAYDRYNQDRTRALQEWSTNANMQNQYYQNQYNKNKDLLGVSQNAQDNLMNAFGTYTQNNMNLNNTTAQNYANLVQQQAANENSRKGILGRVFG